MRAAVQNSPAGNTNWSKLSFGVALGWLAAYQYFKLPPILPLLLGQYDYDPLVAGGFMSVFALAGLLISAWVGHNLQRIGVLPLLITACAWLLLGTLAGLSWPESAALMLLARCGEAVGYAVLAVVGVILTVSAASSRDRPLAAGLWATWIPAGQILAAILAALLPEGDWRTMWTLGLVFTLAMAVWGMLLTRSGAFSGASPATEPTAAIRPLPTSHRGLVAASAAVFALWSAQFIAYMTWLPQFLAETHDLEMTEIAGGYALVPAMIILFNLVAVALLRMGIGIGKLMTGALVTQALLWFLMPHTHSLAGGVAALACYGMASGIVPTCLFSLPHLLADSQQGQARAYGVLMTGRNLGALLGPVLLPQIRLLTGSWNGVMPIFGMVTLGAACVALFVFARLARQSHR